MKEKVLFPLVHFLKRQRISKLFTTAGTRLVYINEIIFLCVFLIHKILKTSLLPTFIYFQLINFCWNFLILLQLNCRIYKIFPFQQLTFFSTNLHLVTKTSFLKNQKPVLSMLFSISDVSRKLLNLFFDLLKDHEIIFPIKRMLYEQYSLRNNIL